MQQRTLITLVPLLAAMLPLLHRRSLLAWGKPCCFKFRGWDNPCENVTCSDNAQCVPALNMNQYKCICPNDCWDVGDSDDSGPVCGGDGVTYESLCHLQRASCHAAVMVKPRYKGECDPCARLLCPVGQRCVLGGDRRPRCDCGEVCQPGSQQQTPRRLVCASNGNKYRDECHMAHESCLYSLNLTMLPDPDCPEGKYCPAGCPHPYMQCRVDPATLASACHCPDPCPPVLNPVCGSDNVTYDSLCHLRRSACLRGVPPAQLLPLHRGDCGLTGACRQPRNRCQFGGVCRAVIARREIDRHRVGYALSVACKRPECLWTESPDDAQVADRWMLMSVLTAAGGEFNVRVCGTDAVTHKSECHMRQRAFDLKQDIGVSERGSCNACQGHSCPFFGFCRVNKRGSPECYCHSICGWTPNMPAVCGSDGNQYMTECDLRLQACTLKQDIRVVPPDLCKATSGGRRLQQRHWLRMRLSRLKRRWLQQLRHSGISGSADGGADSR